MTKISDELVDRMAVGEQPVPRGFASWGDSDLTLGRQALVSIAIAAGRTDYVPRVLSGEADDGQTMRGAVAAIKLCRTLAATIRPA